jgi:hypothetical protein
MIKLSSGRTSNPQASEKSTQTTPLTFNSNFTETEEFPSKSTQTDTYSQSKNVEFNSRINPKLVDMVVNEIEKFHRECNLFSFAWPAEEKVDVAEQIKFTLEKEILLPPEKIVNPLFSFKIFAYLSFSSEMVLLLLG